MRTVRGGYTGDTAEWDWTETKPAPAEITYTTMASTLSVARKRAQEEMEKVAEQPLDVRLVSVTPYSTPLAGTVNTWQFDFSAVIDAENPKNSS